MHHFLLVFDSGEVAQRHLLLCHSEARSTGEESACCRQENQQIPRAIKPRFGMTICLGVWDLLHCVLSRRIFARRLAPIIVEDGEAQLKTAGRISAAGDGCNFAAPARDYADACADGPCGRMSPAWREASGARAIELPVLPARTQFCRPAKFFDSQPSLVVVPADVQPIADRDLRCSTNLRSVCGLIA